MNELPCGRHPDTDCPFWECCAWGQRESIDMSTAYTLEALPTFRSVDSIREVIG